LQEIVPALSRAILLVNPANPMTPTRLEVVRDAGRALKIEVQVVTASGARELEETLRALERARPGGLIVFEDPVFSIIGQRVRIIEFAARHRVPVVYTQSGWAELGGLVEYAANQLEMFRQAAAYVDRILRGAKPGDLPVEQPARFDLVINLRTARALGRRR
jgi:putative ABC transport system substrate-binding protein